MQTYSKTDPRHQTQNIQTRLAELINDLRQDVQQVDDPKAKALFETSAEVLAGLKTAFTHYEEASEEAWK